MQNHYEAKDEIEPVNVHSLNKNIFELVKHTIEQYQQIFMELLRF